MTHQARIQSLLEGAGIAYKQIEVYGSQVVVTSQSEATARKWAELLSSFASVRGIRKSLDDAKVNKGSTLLPSHVTVWRTFATI